MSAVVERKETTMSLRQFVQSELETIITKLKRQIDGMPTKSQSFLTEKEQNIVRLIIARKAVTDTEQELQERVAERDRLELECGPESISISRWRKITKMSARTQNWLKGAFPDHLTLIALATFSQMELRQKKGGIGRTMLNEINGALQPFGLFLGMTQDQAEQGYKDPNM